MQPCISNDMHSQIHRATATAVAAQNFPKKTQKRLGRSRWRGSIYPARAVCQNDSPLSQSPIEVLSNGAIPFPNELQILLISTNTLPKSLQKQCLMLLLLLRKTFSFLDFKTLSNQASSMKLCIQFPNNIPQDHFFFEKI